MIFNSLTFVVFFAIVLAAHNARFFSWHQKKINLMIFSYLFYAAWNPPFVILLWVSTVVDWWAAQWMVRSKRHTTRKAWMLISVVVNLGMLGYFKYGEFLLANFVTLAASVGVDYRPPEWNIILPVGISFYTFATLSYTLDVYLRRAKPAKHFLDYALFVTFFPHLVAGPIMRPTELVPQFAEPRRATAHQLHFGLALIILGLFQKVVLADGFLGPVVEKVYDAREGVPMMLDAWVATLAFSGQIFCDFAGYSTTAIGVALSLGFAMPDNFRFPYAAVGFSDFWRRWHISLSSWLRDYLYIPLGGNKHGPRRTYGALMGTMLLGGLWHGAAWTFVVWGGLHGLYLAVERWLKGKFGGWTPRARVDRRARPAHLHTDQHHLGVLPRQGFHRRLKYADLDGRPRRETHSDDRFAADDLRDGHRRRDRRHPLGDARQDAGDRGRAHPIMGGRGPARDHEHRHRRRTGEGQCLHLLPILSPPKRPRGASCSAKARSPPGCA